MNQKAICVIKQSGKALCYYALFLGTQLLVTIVYMFLAAIVIGIQSVQSGNSSPSPDEITTQLLQMINRHIGIIMIIYSALTLLFLWLFFLIRRRKFRTEAGILPFQTSLLPFLLLFALGITGFFNTVLNLLPESWLEAYGESASFLDQGPFWSTLIATTLCAPIVEEIIFRGLILSRLKKAMPVWLAMVLSSLLFGIAHGQILWAAYTFLIGLLLCVIAEHTGSIAPTMLIHLIFNGLGTCLSYSEFQFTLVTFWGMLIGGTILIVVSMYLILRK